MNDTQKSLFESHNNSRAKYKIAALSWNEELAKAAQSHSDFMAKKSQLAHKGIGDGDPQSRCKDAGYEGFSGWENIAQGQRTVEEVMRDWMSSSGHRANILEKNVNEIGVAVAQGNHGFFWTSNFGKGSGVPTPKPEPSPSPTPTPNPEEELKKEDFKLVGLISSCRPD